MLSGAVRVAGMKQRQCVGDETIKYILFGAFAYNLAFGLMILSFIHS